MSKIEEALEKVERGEAGVDEAEFLRGVIAQQMVTAVSLQGQIAELRGEIAALKGRLEAHRRSWGKTAL